MDITMDMQLLESIVENGLAQVGSYIEKTIKKTVIIADSRGYIHYPEKSNRADEAIENLLGMLPELEENQYFYQKSDALLMYPIGNGQIKAVVVIKKVEQDLILPILDAITEVDLAIKHYIHTENKVEQKFDSYKKNIIEDLIVRKSINIDYIAKQTGIKLDNDNVYAILLMKIDRADETFIKNKVKDDMLKYCFKHNMEFIEPIVWNEYFISILSSVKKDIGLGVGDNWPDIEHYFLWKEQFEEKYHVNVAIGIGDKYDLNHIHKSYNEAMIAIEFNLIKEKNSFIQKFADLGIFAEIFSKDINQINQFCMNTLEKVLEYDHDFDANLLITIRTLFDCNFNWRLASKKLFVHVNTLRYRYEKVEQLLEVDLSLPDERVNLFVTVRVSDVLKKLGFLQSCYVGKVVCNGNIKKQSKALCMS